MDEFENSVVLICGVLVKGAMNSAVADDYGDAPAAVNISIPLTNLGLNIITHWGGHGWMDDSEVVAMKTIPGLTVAGAKIMTDTPTDAHDHWARELQTRSLRIIDSSGGGAPIVLPLLPVINLPPVAAAIAAFNAAFP